MRITLYTFFSFLFVLCSFNSNGQSSTIDSLKRVSQTQKGEDTNRISTLIALGKISADSTLYDDALNYANQALELSKKLGFKSGEARTYRIIASICDTRGDYAAARNNYLAGKTIYEELKDKSQVAYFTNLVADSYRREGDVAEALKISYRTLQLYDELKDKSGVAYAYLFLGDLFYLDKNYAESLRNFLLSQKLYEEIGNKLFAAFCKLGIGRIDAKNEDYDEALGKYSEVLNVVENVSAVATGEVHRCIGEVFESLGRKNKASSKENYSKAAQHYLQNLSIYQDMNDKGGITTAYYHVGKINIALGNFQSARAYLTNGLRLAQEIRAKGDLQDIYLGLSMLDSTQGNFKQAHEHYKKHVLYRDSIFNEETKKKLVRASMQYEFEKKETAAKLAQLEAEQEGERKRRGQWRVIASLGSLIVIFLLIMFFQFRNSRHKKRANLLLQQQKEKVESTLSELRSTQSQLIQSEKMASLGELTAGIAHEIQNPLNFVNNFSDVNAELIAEAKQEMTNGNIDQAIVILNDIYDNERKINHHGKRADAIVKGMLQHSRASSGQKEPTDINALADEYLRLAYHGMRAKDKSFNVTTKTEFDPTIGKIKVVSQEIGRVILNLINNGFYACAERSRSTVSEKQNLNGYEPTVSVSTKRTNGKVEIRVADNGNGIPQKVLDKIFQPFFTTKPTGQGTGLGLSLAYDIITKGHGGELKVETQEGIGSEFIILIPAQ